MLTSFLWLGLGLAALIVGGDLTVRGATSISRALGVSPLFIGLTVVAFGTSAPELAVNVISSLKGQTDLAFGGVVGSNLANIGLILALAVIITQVRVQGQILRREIPLLLLVTAVLLILCLDPLLRDAPALLDASDGMVLLALFVLFLYVNVGDVLQHSDDPFRIAVVHGRVDGPDQAIGAASDTSGSHRTSTALALTVAGLVALTIGGDMTVTYASQVARHFGVSEVVIGLVLVAIGTSLPELVTSLLAARHNQPDLAVGNIIGSNLFNTLFVLGLSALITPLPVPAGGIGDLVINLLLVALLIPFAITGPRRLVRMEGVALLVGYLAYLWYRFNF